MFTNAEIGKLTENKRFMGQRKNQEVAGFFVFSHIRMIGYFRIDLG